MRIALLARRVRMVYSPNLKNFTALPLDGGGFACPPSRAAQAKRTGVGVITLPLIPSRQGRGHVLKDKPCMPAHSSI